MVPSESTLLYLHPSVDPLILTLGLVTGLTLANGTHMMQADACIRALGLPSWNVAVM